MRGNTKKVDTFEFGRENPCLTGQDLRSSYSLLVTALSALGRVVMLLACISCKVFQRQKTEATRDFTTAKRRKARLGFLELAVIGIGGTQQQG